MNLAAYITPTNGTYYVEFYDKDRPGRQPGASSPSRYKRLRSCRVASWDEGARLVERETGRRPTRRGQARVLHVPDPQVDDWNRGDGTSHPRHTGVAPRRSFSVRARLTKSPEGKFMDEPTARQRAGDLERLGYDVEFLVGAPNEHAGRMLYRQAITSRPHALLCRGVPDDPRWQPFWEQRGLRIEIIR